MIGRLELGLRCVALALLAGCVPVTQSARSDPPTVPQRRPDFAAPSSDLDRENRAALASYFELLARLENGGPDARSRLYTASRAAYDADPDALNALRLATVLSAPDRSPADVGLARDLLFPLTTSRDALSPKLRTLASVRLREVEHRMALHDKIRTLEKDLDRASRDDQRDRQSRAALERELVRTKADLAAAQAKLRAVTNIERSMEHHDNARSIP